MSPRLFDLLNVEASTAKAVAEIAANPVLLAETINALPDLKRAAIRPAGAEGVMRVIGRRFALYPQAQRSEGEWSEWWADYVDPLGALPEEALEAAMATWVATPGSHFLPKPCDLLELAKRSPTHSTRVYQRAREAIAYRPAEATATMSKDAIEGLVKSLAGQRRREPSPAEKEQVAAMYREYAMKHDARREKAKLFVAGLPDTAGLVGEKGITSALGDLINRQRDQIPRGP